MTTGIEDAAAEYEKLSRDWGEALNDATRANKLFDQIHHLANQLKVTASGRLALERLLTSDSRAVRLNAATACLQWAPDAARPVLAGLGSPRGEHSLSAEMTLREFDAGRLKFDWQG